MMTDLATAQPFVDHYGRLKAESRADEPLWLGALREAGCQRFAAVGLPTQRLEAWKYTSLRPLEKIPFGPAAPELADQPASAPPGLLPEALRPIRLVFVAGRFRDDLSAIGDLPEGAAVISLADAAVALPDLVAPHLGRVGAADGHAMIALNTAFMEDGPVLNLAPGTVLDRPVEVVFLGAESEAPLMWHPRLLIVAAANSAATVIEHHAGPDGAPYFANGVTEIVLGEGARLRHYKLQAEGMQATHVSTVTASLARDSRYDGFVLSAGARLSRSEVRAVLAGPGASCNVNGAYMVRGRQHCDNTTLIDHAAPHCRSREVFQGVIDDGARAVFQGKILVRPGAQKTDGYQLNRALLLSEHAEIDSKPELEIYADDVKCSHGATVGALDEEALFYLRARGIDREAARGLLVRAFLGAALEEMDFEPARDALAAAVDGWLGRR